MQYRPVRSVEDVAQVINAQNQLAIFIGDFFSFQAGKLIESQLQDVIGLRLAKGITAVYQTRLAANPNTGLLYLLPAEFVSQQLNSRFFPICRTPNDLDKVIKIGQCDKITFQRFGSLLRLTQKVAGTS